MAKKCRKCGGPNCKTWRCNQIPTRTLTELCIKKRRGRPIRRATWRAAGTLVLWPNNLVPSLLKKVCKVAQQIRATKMLNTTIDIVALPVELDCGSNCIRRSVKASTDVYCAKDCPMKQYFENQISSSILMKSRALNPTAEVRPNFLKKMMNNNETTFNDIRNRFKDHSWICIVEGVTREGLQVSPFYCHVDCNISGWGSSKNAPNDRSQFDMATRVTREETGLQVDLLLKRKEIEEFGVYAYRGHRVYFYVPTSETSLTEESIEVQAARLREQLAKLQSSPFYSSNRPNNLKYQNKWGTAGSRGKTE
jgi:hypothetical protein